MSRSPEVDEYIAALPDDRRSAMAQLREIVLAAAPAATETIAYNMPALRLDGRFMLSYDAFKNHYSLFPASQMVIDELGAEVSPYVRGKGTLQFKSADPLPLDLIRRIAEIRLRETSEAGS